MDEWVKRAALYELLAKSFLYTSEDVAEALVAGEFVEALIEIASLNGIDEHAISEIAGDFTAYQGRDTESVFHDLRKEYTRLFIGVRQPQVSPYAGIWSEENVSGVLFVSKETQAVEKFMRSCGSGQPEGTNVPLDHVGTELEFLEYLCLLKGNAAEAPEGIEVPDDAYDRFFGEHFAWWIPQFSEQVKEQSREPFFSGAARLLQQVV